MSARTPRIAFYAPMKSPDHPVPSGDRKIARLTLTALHRAGFSATVVSRLRTLEMTGDLAVQASIRTKAEDEIEALAESLSREPPDLWFTYHCYYKAPDLVGPALVRRFGCPYAISEPSVSRRRRIGPWSRYAGQSEEAIAAADRLFWTTERDRPALEAMGFGVRMTHLPAFVDPGEDPVPRPAGTPLRLLTVAMMRPGDKLTSYRRLAAALRRLSGDWTLDIYGDGSERVTALTAFEPLADRVRWHGTESDSASLRRIYESADLLVWPGVNEGVGMVWLEAQAAGLPAIAEDSPAARAAIATPTLAPPSTPEAFADIIAQAARNRTSLSAMARAHIVENHSIASAATVLRQEIQSLLP